MPTKDLEHPFSTEAGWVIDCKPSPGLAPPWPCNYQQLLLTSAPADDETLDKGILTRQATSIKHKRHPEKHTSWLCRCYHTVTRSAGYQEQLQCALKTFWRGSIHVHNQNPQTPTPFDWAFMCFYSMGLHMDKAPSYHFLLCAVTRSSCSGRAPLRLCQSKVHQAGVIKQDFIGPKRHNDELDFKERIVMGDNGSSWRIGQDALMECWGVKWWWAARGERASSSLAASSHLQPACVRVCTSAGFFPCPRLTHTLELCSPPIILWKLFPLAIICNHFCRWWNFTACATEANTWENFIMIESKYLPKSRKKISSMALLDEGLRHSELKYSPELGGQPCGPCQSPNNRWCLLLQESCCEEDCN